MTKIYESLFQKYNWTGNGVVLAFRRKKWVIVSTVIILCLSISYITSSEFRRFICNHTGYTICYAAYKIHPEAELSRNLHRKMK